MASLETAAAALLVYPGLRAVQSCLFLTVTEREFVTAALIPTQDADGNDIPLMLEDGVHHLNPVRAFYPSAPFCAMGQKIDFVYLIPTMPGRHSGDQVQ